MIIKNLRILTILFLIILFSCNSIRENTLDLSNRGLKSIPDFSKKKNITTINLSNNFISEWDEKKLPVSVKRINLSNNSINGEVKLSQKSLPNLRCINFSNNKIERFYSYSFSIDSIIINNNNLKRLLIFNSLESFSKRKISFLDISQNADFSNALDFPPDNVKFIKHDNIKNNKDLYFKIIKNKK